MVPVAHVASIDPWSSYLVPPGLGVRGPKPLVTMLPTAEEGRDVDVVVRRLTLRNSVVGRRRRPGISDCRGHGSRLPLRMRGAPRGRRVARLVEACGESRHLGPVPNP